MELRRAVRAATARIAESQAATVAMHSLAVGPKCGQRGEHPSASAAHPPIGILKVFGGGFGVSGGESEVGPNITLPRMHVGPHEV